MVLLVRKTKLNQIQLHDIALSSRPSLMTTALSSRVAARRGNYRPPCHRVRPPWPPTGSSTRRVAGHTDLVSAATAEGADALFLVSLESEFWVRIRKGEAVGLPFLEVVGPIGSWYSTLYSRYRFVLCSPRSRGASRMDIISNNQGPIMRRVMRLVAMSSLTNPQCWNS
jgi:hypothetical protein